jgi:hypothetical protein
MRLSPYSLRLAAFVDIGGRPLGTSRSRSTAAEARSMNHTDYRLTIPLISDQPVNISQKRLLENELGELLHKQP